MARLVWETTVLGLEPGVPGKGNSGIFDHRSPAVSSL